MSAGLDMERFLVADVGSTTTKVTLFAREGEGWRYRRSEAPTTVEKPHEDVCIGLRNALAALEEASGLRLRSEGRPVLPLFATSSAGGGLAMVVTGLVADLTAETADRAALGAGAIVLDTLAMNDGRTPYRKIEDLRRLRPDMVLLAGGFDADAITGPVYLAELLVEAGLRPKLSPNAQLPVVYAGNVNAREQVERVLGERYRFMPVENIRPDAGTENMPPARQAIHDLFMNHVMSQAPGYDRLQEWVAAPIIPTPAAFGVLLASAAARLERSILAVDIGGATTDVFSAREGEVFRTVSANLGLSYSIRNVAELAGVAAIDRLYRPGCEGRETWNIIGNKALNPTRLAADPGEMRVEWGTAVIAVRAAVEHHHRVLREEPEPIAPQERDIVALLRLPRRREEKPARPLAALAEGCDMLIGSGGIMSHSPRPAAAMMLIDALQPTKDIELAVDRAFLFPHLGVLASVNPDLALELFDKLALVRLGRVRAPGGRNAVRVAGREVGAGEVAAMADGDGEVGLVVDNRPRPVETGAAELVAGNEYRPDVRPADTVREAVVSEGPLEMRRELAIPGEVLVRPGDRVEPETVIARSERQFLRPFFLDVASALARGGAEAAGHPPSDEDVAEWLTVKPGDEIDVGDVLARRPRRLLGDKRFRSNVAGRVERLLPGGVLVVRERPEAAREYTSVPAAKELGIEPGELAHWLRVEPGQEVERGQWLVAVGDPTKLRVSRSPVRGRVNRVDEAFGMVIIEPLLEEVLVRAWLPGEVSEVSDRGAVVTGAGRSFSGSWGLGGERWGRLTGQEPGPGLVAVRAFADAELLARCEAAGCAGLICAGLDLADAIGLSPAFTLVMTGRYGDRDFTPAIGEALAQAEGGLVLLSGTTQLRVGVVRPRVILPG